MRASLKTSGPAAAKSIGEELDMLYFDEADEKKYRPVGRISGEAYQACAG